MLTITCKALRVPSGGRAPLCTPVDSAQPSPRPGTASAPPTTNRVTQLGSGSAGTRLPGSIQGHLWGQGGHAHWPGTRAVPRTAQPDARSATAAGFLSSRLQNGESPSPPRGLVLRVTRSYKADRRAPHTEAQLVPDRGSGCAGDAAVSAGGDAAGRGNPTRPSPEELCYATL